MRGTKPNFKWGLQLKRMLLAKRRESYWCTFIKITRILQETNIWSFCVLRLKSGMSEKKFLDQQKIFCTRL